MIDIHSHIIPNIDDGSSSIKETFNLIEEARKVGFTDIILTPHYITNYYETPPQEINSWRDATQKVIEDKNFNIHLYSGMEIYIAEDIDNLIKENKILTLAGTNYLLIEFPMNSIIKSTDEIIFTLQTMGYKIIIAHPERYKFIQEDPDMIENLINKNCLLQCNYGSLAGIYGKSAEKIVKYLLKNELVNFMATDVHKEKTIYTLMPKILKKLKKIVTDEYFEEITEINAREIINNK